MLVFVGIDWADREHEVCIIDQEGTELTRFRVAHSRQGFETLKEQVLRRRCCGKIVFHMPLMLLIPLVLLFLSPM